MCVYVIYAFHSRWKWLQCEHLLATLVMLEDAWWIHPWGLPFSRRCDVMHWGIERRYSTGSDQFPHRRWSEEVHGADDGLQEWSKPKQLAKDEWMVQLHKAIRSSYFWHDHSFVNCFIVMLSLFNHIGCIVYQNWTCWLSYCKSWKLMHAARRDETIRQWQWDISPVVQWI